MAPEGPLALRAFIPFGSRSTANTTRSDDRGARSPFAVSRAAVAAQHALVMRLYSGLEATWTDFKPVAELRDAVAKMARGDTYPRWESGEALVTTLDSIAGDSLKTRARSGMRGRRHGASWI